MRDICATHDPATGLACSAPHAWPRDCRQVQNSAGDNKPFSRISNAQRGAISMNPRYLPSLPQEYVFLGQYEEFDLYFYDDGKSATLIGRYGHGPLNKAFFLTLLGLPELDVAPPWLIEAYGRAKARGLIGERDQ